ncbi:MAG: transglycosylase SLT domain-containing protein [Betaproteobacteria bacterium]
MPPPSAAPPEPAAAMGPPEPEPPIAVAPTTEPAPMVANGAFSPTVAADLEPLPEPAEDLWERIRKGYAIADLDDKYVTKWEAWYGDRPDYVARMVDRSRRYLYHIVVEVAERKMPLEIALLPMVESAYNPTAMSTSRASGIWQFIPSTGTHYGLKQNFWFDSRRDVIAATDGALNYLQKLYADFGDWQLALAAYNWGEGNVARAIAKNRKLGLPTDYASLKMPDETRNYLPKLQAVKNIVRDPARYGLELADIPDAPYFAVVKTTRKMDVKRAAELAKLSIDEFQYLNPRFNRPVIAGADEYTILLPIDNAEIFAAKLDLVDQPLVSWQAYRLRPGETLPQVAAKFEMPVETLRAVNGIGARARIPPGHTLLVPSQRASAASEETLAKAVFTTVPQGRTFYYRVKRGDTMAGIAGRYAVTAQEIRGWNGLAENAVSAGQQLRITSDLAPNAAKAKRPTGKRVLVTKAKPVRAKPVPAKPLAAKPAAAKPAVAKPTPAPRSARAGQAPGG